MQFAVAHARISANVYVLTDIFAEQRRSDARFLCAVYSWAAIFDTVNKRSSTGCSSWQNWQRQHARDTWRHSSRQGQSAATIVKRAHANSQTRNRNWAWQRSEPTTLFGPPYSATPSTNVVNVSLKTFPATNFRYCAVQRRSVFPWNCIYDLDRTDNGVDAAGYKSDHSR